MEKESKRVFVIMPFVEANQRDRSDLDEFYAKTLKEFVEGIDDLHFQYRVSRSGTEFNIQKNIILQLREADLVLCDLSGSGIPNPNVMFELGVRFAISRKPVILFREEADGNRGVFDVGWLHTHSYKATQVSALQTYIREKLAEYEIEPASYESPVLEVLGSQFAVDIEARRSQLINCLDSVAYGLRAVEMHMLREIASYLEGKLGKDPTPDNVDDFHTWWMDKREEISGYDWSSFDFEVRGLAPLEHLFVDMQLSVYLPEAVRRAVNSKLYDFYVEHFACTIPIRGDFARINNFLVRLANTTVLTSILIGLIGEDDPGKKLALYDALNGALQ